MNLDDPRVLLGKIKGGGPLIGAGFVVAVSVFIMFHEFWPGVGVLFGSFLALMMPMVRILAVCFAAFAFLSWGFQWGAMVGGPILGGILGVIFSIFGYKTFLNLANFLEDRNPIIAMVYSGATSDAPARQVDGEGGDDISSVFRYKRHDEKVDGAALKVVAVLGVFAIAIFLMKSLPDLKSVQTQVAGDFEKQYNSVSKYGSSVDKCVRAGLVAEGYLQAGDNAKYREWKGVERSDCWVAGIKY